MHNKFELKVLSTIKKYSMLQKGDSVLVGLSGGKDSAVLLFVLHSLSRLLGVKVSAFHLNHMIRGDEAKRDEDFSEDLCKSLGVPFYSEQIDVPSLVDGRGLEVAAREARYGAFYRTAERIGANKIATAHTLSDNSETLFISLIRSGTLSPIPQTRDMVIRPLIEVTTEEVVGYAREKGIPFIFDSTNASNDYLRNYLRSSILPELREKQESFDNTLLKAGKIYNSYKLLAISLADKYFNETPIPEGLSSLSHLANDTSMHSVLFAVLSRICDSHGISLTYERFEKIVDAIAANEVGTTVSLASQKSLRIGYDRIFIEESRTDTDVYSIPLVHGRNVIPDSPFAVYLEYPEEYNARVSDNKQKINKIIKNNKIYSSIITDSLYFRPKLDGDKYRCRGITRSVKKYFIDSKIDRHLRESFPILCDNEGIVWVAGLGIADRVESVKDGDLLYLSLEITQ